MYVISHRFLVFNFFIFLFFQVDYYMIYIKWTLCLSKKKGKKKKRERERKGTKWKDRNVLFETDTFN